MDLTGTRLENTSFEGCDFTGSLFQAAIFHNTNFPSAILRGSNFEGCQLNRGVSFAYADLRDCVFNSANIEGALFLGADLRGASLAYVKNFEVAESFKGANIAGLRDAPPGFALWAMLHGAVAIQGDAAWEAWRRRNFGHVPAVRSRLE